jgi:hypothetical protein
MYELANDPHFHITADTELTINVGKLVAKIRKSKIIELLS